ncbi:MAG: DUF192 domain-containing protein [Candidatus Micrarchaeota archaeon]
MENIHFLILIFVFVAIVLIVYFQFSGNKREQMIIVNSEGSEVIVNVEIADTQLKKMRGLMFRESMPENDGMLFVFGSPGTYSFWMVNTSIPLDAIYFSSDGQVVDVISMEPCGAFKCPTYAPKAQAQYVLEVNRGFAEKHGIAAGKSRAKSIPN